MSVGIFMLKESQRERIQYWQEMLREMSRSMKAERLPMLTYLTEMAYLEASDMLRKDYEERRGSREAEAA